MEARALAKLYISGNEQGIIVFRLRKSLSYPKRMALSFLLILAGFAAQYFTNAFYPGLLPILFGNLLLIVKGYDNRVHSGKYKPAASWEKVNPSKLNEVEMLHREMKRWDRSLLDITSPLGFMMLLVISIIIATIFYNGFMRFNDLMQISAYDAILLIVPHWMTGIRSTLTKPNLILKITKLKKLLKNSAPLTANHSVEYYMLLAGDDAKIPDDVKIKVNIRGQHKDFLGCYGQIVTNEVNGTAYPYFYVVLVAKKGFGLEEFCRNYTVPKKITTEFKIEGDVEVFVIRQATTKTSGYYTNDKQMAFILAEGIKVSESCAVK